MRPFDLFEFYRFMLAVLVTTYSVIKLLTAIWRWRGIYGEAGAGSAVLYRYLLVLLLRARSRRFAYELTIIGGLVAVFVLLVWRHWH